MFNWLKELFVHSYNFSEWDKGEFPLGRPSVERFLQSGKKVDEIVHPITFTVSPSSAHLLNSPPSWWPGEIKIDENLVPTKPTGRYVSRKALWEICKVHGIVAERAA